MNNGGEVLPSPLIIWHRQQFLSAITPIIFEYSSIFLMVSEVGAISKWILTPLVSAQAPCQQDGLRNIRQSPRPCQALSVTSPVP